MHLLKPTISMPKPLVWTKAEVYQRRVKKYKGRAQSVPLNRL
jgi:hypothetical protein